MAERARRLAAALNERFGNQLSDCRLSHGEVTVEVRADLLRDIATHLRDDEGFCFEQLIDLCGVDYLTYGQDEWMRGETSESGFSRGVNPDGSTGRLRFGAEPVRRTSEGTRFVVVIHLLSLSLNQRLRVRVPAPDDDAPRVPTVTDIWPAANWYEREAFDLFGILFDGHPDLRRILTDYGFIGHPFRKDFPLVGHVEMRYDPTRKRVVYEPVTIEPRVLVPKVIRDDNRYAGADPEGE